MADYELIETRADLDALAHDLLGEKVIAVDTEADSFYHYFDKTCLVQIATARQIYLIDPLALGGPAELSPLAPVFASPNIRKIFHAAEYDIFVLKRDCSFQFANLFDTMISRAAARLSVGGTVADRRASLRREPSEGRAALGLVARVRSPSSSMSYAASDVLYLLPLAERLGASCSEAKRQRWAEEEFETLCRRRWPDREFDELGYLRIKGARKLDPKALVGAARAVSGARPARARDGSAAVQGARQPHADRDRGAPAEEALRARRDQGHHRSARCAGSAARCSPRCATARKDDHGPLPKLAAERPAAHGSPRRSAPARAQALARRARAASSRSTRRAVPELGARGDRLARARARASDLEGAARAQGLVRARVRRRGRGDRARGAGRRARPPRAAPQKRHAPPAELPAGGAF